MSTDMVERIFDLSVGHEDSDGKTFDFLFHAGEPMAIGLDNMRLIADLCIAKARPQVDFRFSIQTNGTLIDKDWATFFTDYGFAVGVSIDGPKFLNDSARVTRNGKSTFDKTVRGIEIMLENGHTELGCLSTLTEESLRYPDQIMDFFLELGVAALGFNLEDIENDNKVTTFGLDRHEKISRYRKEKFEPFLNRIFERWWPERHNLRVREFADVLRATALRKQDKNYYRFPDSSRPLGIITVDRLGNITTFAPEFASAYSEKYNNFIVGHINEIDSFYNIIKNKNFKSLYSDIEKGINQCRTKCEYFALCGSSYVSNRYFEYGDFKQAETFTCHMMRKTATDVAFEQITNMVATPTTNPAH